MPVTKKTVKRAAAKPKPKLKKNMTKKKPVKKTKKK
jgi:hypothetical protein